MHISIPAVSIRRLRNLKKEPSHNIHTMNVEEKSCKKTLYVRNIQFRKNQQKSMGHCWKTTACKLLNLSRSAVIRYLQVRQLWQKLIYSYQLLSGFCSSLCVVTMLTFEFDAICFIDFLTRILINWFFESMDSLNFGHLFCP